eukprot:gene3450-biopygen20226
MTGCDAVAQQAQPSVHVGRPRGRDHTHAVALLRRARLITMNSDSARLPWLSQTRAERARPLTRRAVKIVCCAGYRAFAAAQCVQRRKAAECSKHITKPGSAFPGVVDHLAICHTHLQCAPSPSPPCSSPVSHCPLSVSYLDQKWNNF